VVGVRLNEAASRRFLCRPFDDDVTRTRAQQAGAQAYFSKPFDDQALLDAIEIYIRSRTPKTC
jgi:DNA-binding response OmpR family regulator